jgi:hypothetical protein
MIFADLLRYIQIEQVLANRARSVPVNIYIEVYQRANKRSLL